MASLTLQATTPAVCCSCGRATPALTITEATPKEPRAEAETEEEEEEAMPRDGAGLFPAESLVSFFFFNYFY
jgi:ribosomal protein L12E/L44/L45/RPP1/RPP2